MFDHPHVVSLIGVFAQQGRFYGCEIEQQEVVGGAEFAVEGWRTGDLSSQREIDLEEFRNRRSLLRIESSARRCGCFGVGRSGFDPEFRVNHTLAFEAFQRSLGDDRIQSWKRSTAE